MSFRISNFEMLIMLTVLRLGDEAYGVLIRDEMARRMRRSSVPLGSVYAALMRLQAKGWVTSRLGEATAVRGGKAKTYFEVSSKGLREVRESRRTLMDFWKGVPRLS